VLILVNVNEVGGKGLEGKANAGLETTEEGTVGIAKGEGEVAEVGA
jgi:hypothetical protein